MDKPRVLIVSVLGPSGLKPQWPPPPQRAVCEREADVDREEIQRMSTKLAARRLHLHQATIPVTPSIHIHICIYTYIHICMAIGSGAQGCCRSSWPRETFGAPEADQPTHPHTRTHSIWHAHLHAPSLSLSLFLPSFSSRPSLSLSLPGSCLPPAPLFSPFSSCGSLARLASQPQTARTRRWQLFAMYFIVNWDALLPTRRLPLPCLI